MRILFTMGHAYFPQRGGGAQSNTDQLVHALIGCGHKVAVACALSGGGWVEKHSRITRTITRKKFSMDRTNGYLVYRAWDPADLTEVAKRFRPDVAIVQNGSTVPMAKSLDDAGIPTVVYFHNVEFDDLGGDPRDLRSTIFVSNSRFTAQRVLDVYSLSSAVIRPYVPPALYQTATLRENVTFINPYPEKGADIAFNVARLCPEIPFVFVESWGLDAKLRADINRRIAELSNVILLLRTDDMKTIYGRARILLAPSLWEEAWGRVATEAHFNGIPVVGSKQGGLPEAVGPGGLTIDIASDASLWADTVRTLWNDKDKYENVSRAAIEFSRRIEMQTSHIISELLQMIYCAIARKHVVIDKNEMT